MAKELLDTNRINYLIWRYLVESDYPETAVRLQQEWNIQDPQQLSFAPHVKNHALVSVLNRGLLYNVQERLSTQPNGDVAGDASGTGFFGPLMPPSPAADEDFENARKRQIDNEQPQIQAGPPAKKPRLSNGYDPRFESSTPMDVDEEQNGDENAYPSPEQVPSPAVVTNGPETGTQVDKVYELSSETTFLELSDDPASKNTVLLQCEFHPRDPTILAAAGTDALARMWTLSRMSSISASGSESPGKPVFAPHRNLLEDGVPNSTTATGLAWDSYGKYIAVASEPQDDGIAKVEFWNLDGSSFATFNGFDSPIICIRWNPSDTSLLAISPRNDNKDTLITIMYPTMEASAKFAISGHSLLDQALDAAWTGNDEFVICGGDVLQSFQVIGDVITAGRKYDTGAGSQLSRVTWDKHSRLLVTASDTGTIDVWDQSGGRKSFNAHQGLITALEWQPLHPPVVLGEDSERILASAGEDGAISLWNARSTEAKCKASMTMGSAVIALAFTPDGAFIAGGTNENVLIWKSDDVHLPRATWARPVEAGWRTPQSHDSVTDEDQFSLCWDASGQKLAYGVNSRLAVINFRS